MSEEIKDNNHSENNGGRLPFCTCGKCIVKRQEKTFLQVFHIIRTYLRLMQGTSTGRTQKRSQIFITDRSTQDLKAAIESIFPQA